MKVWDGFVRFFHWALVLLLIGLYVSAENDMMDLHQVLAYVLMALLLTRLVWGVIGSDTAKISSLLHQPKAVLDTIKQPSRHNVGHNPAGSYMVLLFFVLLMIQLLTGLFSSDDITTEGPLSKYVSSGIADFVTEWHEVNFGILLAAIVVHILAIVAYRVKGLNLVKPMLIGKNDEIDAAEQKPVNFKPSWWAFVLFALLLVLLMNTWGELPLKALM